ncbi:hypothetical protein OS493_028769 [Desmophyllum pertusum]|uniref:Uncharacterized protein n=1 Tax=Desmophyllum pertusum TaxID=174260 RepID=A0A9W9Y956_9CNID|nr:hypothetical protein OS493_028769 [Desmophyllum pertusum]
MLHVTASYWRAAECLLAGSRKQGTIHLEEYLVQIKIRMVDTRGFYESDERLMDEYLKIMSGR